MSRLTLSERILIEAGIYGHESLSEIAAKIHAVYLKRFGVIAPVSRVLIHLAKPATGLQVALALDSAGRKGATRDAMHVLILTARPCARPLLLHSTYKSMANKCHE